MIVSMPREAEQGRFGANKLNRHQRRPRCCFSVFTENDGELLHSRCLEEDRPGEDVCQCFCVQFAQTSAPPAESSSEFEEVIVDTTSSSPKTSAQYPYPSLLPVYEGL